MKQPNPHGAARRRPLLPPADLREGLFLFLLVLLLFSLVYSRYLLSVSMLGLMGTLFLKEGPGLRFGLQGWRRAVQQLRARPAPAAMMVFFGIVLIGGLYATETGYWLERLRIKLPLVGLPLAFAAGPALRRHQLAGLLYFWVGMLVLTCLGVGVNYVLHFEEIQEGIKRGQAIPVPTNHVRFSLMMALGVVAAGWLWLRRFSFRYRWEPWLLGGCGVFLFLFMHLLAVRSGLAVLYATLGFLALRGAWISRRWWLGAGALALLLGLPLLMYLTLPSFQAKVGYVMWDLKMHLQGKGESYSDSERITSLQVGWEIFRENPWLGVGPGDLKAKVYRRYAEKFGPDKRPFMPHNQWLSIAAGSGLLGLVLALAAFFYPLFYRGNYRHLLLLSFHLILFLSFMVENTIENAVGVGLYASFLLMLLSLRSDDSL